MYKHCLVVKYDTHSLFKGCAGAYHEKTYAFESLHTIYRIMRSYREEEKNDGFIYNVKFELYPYDGTLPREVRIDYEEGEVEIW